MSQSTSEQGNKENEAGVQESRGNKHMCGSTRECAQGRRVAISKNREIDREEY